MRNQHRKETAQFHIFLEEVEHRKLLNINAFSSLFFLCSSSLRKKGKIKGKGKKEKHIYGGGYNRENLAQVVQKGQKSSKTPANIDQNHAPHDWSTPKPVIKDSQYAR
jgi:hypothetical protein